MKLLIIGACLGLASCTPIERDIVEEGVEEIVEHEIHGAKAPVFDPHKFDDRTGAFQTHDDTNPAVYRGRKTTKSLYRPDTRGHQAEANHRQYPRPKRQSLSPGDHGV